MLKQYVFVPKKPAMSAGKIASQVAHATFMALDKQSNIKGSWSSGEPDGDWHIERWKESGMCVIVCEVETWASLIALDKYFEQWNVVHHLYIDEGMTEVEPMTPTALATGIIEDDKQWMFEKFKLFGAKKK